MDLVSDQLSEVAMTVTITRAATGITETFDLIGSITDVIVDDSETLTEEQS